MVRAVVQHVATLAEAPQIGEPVVSRIAVEMRGGEHDAREAKPGCFDQVRPTCQATSTVPPGRGFLIKPATIRQAPELHQVRATADLAKPASKLEPYATA